MTFALAQTEGWMPVLVNAGVAGVMLLWFALRCEGRLKATENSVNRMTRAVLLLVISLKSANDAAKGEARDIVKETERAGAEGDGA